MSSISRIQNQTPDAAGIASESMSNASVVDEACAGSASTAGPSNQSEVRNRVVLPNRNFPTTLSDEIEVFRGGDGYTYIRRLDDRRLPVLRVGTKPCDAFLRRLARDQDKYPRASDVRELNDCLIAHAELAGDLRDVWYRVAPFGVGCEIDLGDAAYTRVQVSPGEVTVITGGSDTLFYRTPIMQALPIPAASGDVWRLSLYLNLDLSDHCLLIAWITYTLSHPKIPTTKFLILLLLGDQGTGKSFLCRIVQAFVDPSDVLLQSFPRSEQDLAIAAQHAHVVIYDNMRELTPVMSDRLCIAATGGTFSTRRLYSDADQLALRLHVAIVLNGISAFVDQPDLAQRCLPITLRHLEERERRDEATMVREFQADMPSIFRGLLNLIAEVLVHLPNVEVENPERMLDFVRWLAAMERVNGVPSGVYQGVYSAALSAGMLESLQAHPLAAAVMGLMDNEAGGSWQGTPRDLYDALDRSVGRRTSYSRTWPQNEIAMAKQLRSLHAGLLRQGIDVRFSRSHKRLITITRVEGACND